MGVEKYYGKLTLDFQVNKKIAEEVAEIQSKRLRNKIAGFTTHLIAHPEGPGARHLAQAPGGERERRMEYVPDRSEVDTDQIHIDADTKEMLRDLNMDKLPNIFVTSAPILGAGGRF